mmetsp:Transcript_2071/g.5273  ORF Transcript_2071/g.5273 Transcript_2071/m.5273 type:complete len:260 (+) Transcript_2071:554-1333(+)
MRRVHGGPERCVHKRLELRVVLVRVGQALGVRARHPVVRLLLVPARPKQHPVQRHPAVLLVPPQEGVDRGDGRVVEHQELVHVDEPQERVVRAVARHAVLVRLPLYRGHEPLQVGAEALLVLLVAACDGTVLHKPFFNKVGDVVTHGDGAVMVIDVNLADAKTPMILQPFPQVFVLILGYDADGAVVLLTWCCFEEIQDSSCPKSLPCIAVSCYVLNWGLCLTAQQQPQQQKGPHMHGRMAACQHADSGMWTHAHLPRT